MVVVHAVPIESIGGLVYFAALIEVAAVSLGELLASGTDHYFFSCLGVNLIEVAIFRNAIQNIVAGDTHCHVTVSESSDSGS